MAPEASSSHVLSRSRRRLRERARKPQRNLQSIIRTLSLILYLREPFVSCKTGLPWTHHKHLEPHPGNESIPHVIHQSWKTDEVPERFVKWQASWTDNHPTWEYRLWTDEQNLKLVEELYPWFLKVFTLLSHIMKADAARYMYMHHYGGVYADLDFQSLRPLDDILRNKRVVLGRMQDDVDAWQHALPNAFMASAPGDNFWLFVLQMITERTAIEEMRKAELMEPLHYWPEERTGPSALWHAYQDYKAAHQGDGDLSVFEKEAFYPLDWRRFPQGSEPAYTDDQGRDCRVCNMAEPQFNSQQCLEDYPNTYALTFWTHSWGR